MAYKLQSAIKGQKKVAEHMTTTSINGYILHLQNHGLDTAPALKTKITSVKIKIKAKIPPKSGANAHDWRPLQIVKNLPQFTSNTCTFSFSLQ